MTFVLASSMGQLRWKQGRLPLPLRVSEFAAFHSQAYNTFADMPYPYTPRLDAFSKGMPSRASP
jgi:hypothetical protein